MPECFDDITDVPGILVGHDTDLVAGTGCTVIRPTLLMMGAVDVRGGAPATKETNLLDPLCMMREVHAIVLAGGSAFGLDAATGVMRELERQGIGYDVGVTHVPIVPAAALFDLTIGSASVRPDAESGARALAAAQSGPVAQGCVGAGTGCTVGKMAGPFFATKSGLGSASATLPDGHMLGAIVAVNAAGDVYDDATGRIVAGARNPAGPGWLAEIAAPPPAGGDLRAGGNTTIAVIATDAPWTKAELSKIAQMAHDGLARTIRPVHTAFDGDTIFALAPCSMAGPADTIALSLAGDLAAKTLARAVLKAVRAATDLLGIPAAT